MQQDELDWNMPLVQYGLGAFETMRCIQGKIPLLNEHFQRLKRALEHWDTNPDQLQDLWAKHRDQLPQKGEHRLKWLISLKQNGGLIDHLYIFDYQPSPNPLSLCIGDCLFTHLQTYKSCNYAEHYLQNKKATQLGCDDMLYLTKDQGIVESSRAAILCIQDEQGIVCSGPRLESVSARYLLKNHSTFWKEAQITLDDLKESSQLYACNALHGLMPIQSIHTQQGQRVYHNPNPGPPKGWNEKLFQV